VHFCCNPIPSIQSHHSGVDVAYSASNRHMKAFQELYIFHIVLLNNHSNLLHLWCGNIQALSKKQKSVETCFSPVHTFALKKKEVGIYTVQLCYE
jgi:hypothetical protein